MKPPAALLAQPATRAVRWLALLRLAEAAAAHAGLDDPAADRALHRFRVALRRLRSLLRAYREPLHGSVRRRHRRQVRDLARATGDSRDAEVGIAWVEGTLPELAGGERPGAEHLLVVLREREAHARRRLRREVAAEWSRLGRRLTRRLSVYQAAVSLDAPAEGPPLSAALAERLAEAAAELRARLAAVHGVDDDEAAHQARIAAKRLRYLLEPFADAVEGAAPVVSALKRLQAALGELHDAETLRGTLLAAEAGLPQDPGHGDDPRPGLRALTHRLHDRRAAAWARVEPEWLGGAEDFFATVEAVRAGLARGGGAPVEIERKYLLNRFPRLPDGAAVRRIEQGWLPGERLQERVRRVRTREGERYFRTVKTGRGVTRVELEEETTRDVFRRLWPLTRGRRVAKRRYAVAHGALVWEIDRFADRRLVLAEVELPSEDTAAEPPEWLRPYIVREVTGESEYVNVNLAK